MPVILGNPADKIYSLLQSLSDRIDAVTRKQATQTILATGSIEQAVVAGAAANTAIAVAGLAAGAQIIGAVLFAAGVPSNITSTVTVSSAGNIKSTAATTGDYIVLTYVNPAS